MVSLEVVVPVVDARERADTQAAEAQHAGVADEVDVGREPTAVCQGLHIVGGFVVTADHQCQHRGAQLAAVVPDGGSREGIREKAASCHRSDLSVSP